MYEMLFFFTRNTNHIAISNTTKLNSENSTVPHNFKFMRQADTIIVFEKGKFHTVLKSRYKSPAELAFDMKDETLKSTVSKLRHWKLSFIIDQEIEILGNFSNPYIVYKALKDEYALLHYEVKTERLRNYEIRPAI